MDLPGRFEPEDVAEPIALFRRWLDDAAQTEPNDANAMSLATATASGRPSVRMVLMKRLDERGFAFYTNVESQKGRELLENPHAALCFHWKSRRRQVRVEGAVGELSAEDADAYFHSRSRKSQIGALASQQSRLLASREELEQRAMECEERYPGEIPRPSYWRGFVLAPERIEFWEDGAYRLHNRIVFVRSGDAWVKTRLFP
ncbi:pyridoxamine 5'-phosphate oxidase [Granulicella arctica]|uniref:Pyridoxamine 5'-phosphate oxidase n=1 Tax=Granulicella arctica TaxID=940613 RepID=A0A7Y9PFW1_9BACT|nr:pyridoxamine 5'-phosphate oxidase [Granulicella arctica]NYF78960.1 pyridoxamine 5'-phosphate oxidase [Granulicella arctica]